MGWSYGWKSREELIAHIDRNWCAGYTVLRAATAGGARWHLVQAPDGSRFIGCHVMGGSGGDHGYKGMDESMGPCEVACPLSFLDEASDPPNEYARAWREKVRAFHASKGAKREALRAGALVDYGGHRYTLVEPCAPRKGWMVKRTSDGLMFRMKATQLRDATPVQPEPAPTPTHDKPCAAPGLTSYRLRGLFGFVMIGATDHADAMREAARSTSNPDPRDLEVWDGAAYVPAPLPEEREPAAPRQRPASWGQHALDLD